MLDDDVVEVYVAADLGEVYFLRELLENAGIEARVVGDTVAALGLPAGNAAAPRLWVHRADEAKSRELLAEFENVHSKPHPDPHPLPAWKCPACSESVDAEMDLCWNCQTPRPVS